jgi:ferredoxin
MTLIVKADRSRCMGHARCNTYAPDIFELDDNGYIAITEVVIKPEDEERARRSVAACPERVLRIETKD